MAKPSLKVAAEGTTAAARPAVWALVADANRYAEWGPWSDGGYEPAATGLSRPGMRQWFTLGRTTSHEEILEVDDGRHVAYTVRKGIPVRNYRADVVLTDTADGGTHVSWSATWDDTFLGRLVYRKLRTFYPQMMDSLVRTATAVSG